MDFTKANLDNALKDFMHLKVNYTDFKIGQSLGKGLHAEVFLATHKPTNQKVALKVYNDKELSDEAKNSFCREVIGLGRSRNPFVLPLLGFTTNSPFCIATEYLKSGTLLDALKEKPNAPKLDNTQRDLIAIALSYALFTVHKKNVIHLDVKSANVLLDERNLPKLGDFSIAQILDDDEYDEDSESGEADERKAIGTPGWMAPEVYDDDFDEKADVFSFGTLLWELLTNKTPFEGKTPVQIMNSIQSEKRPKIPSSTPKGLKKLIKSCWEAQPDDRDSFEEIYADLSKKKVLFEGTDENKIDALLEIIKNSKNLSDQQVDIIKKGLNSEFMKKEKSSESETEENESESESSNSVNDDSKSEEESNKSESESKEESSDAEDNPPPVAPPKQVPAPPPKVPPPPPVDIPPPPAPVEVPSPPAPAEVPPPAPVPPQVPASSSKVHTQVTYDENGQQIIVEYEYEEEEEEEEVIENPPQASKPAVQIPAPPPPQPVAPPQPVVQPPPPEEPKQELPSTISTNDAASSAFGITLKKVETIEKTAQFEEKTEEKPPEQRPPAKIDEEEEEEEEEKKETPSVFFSIENINDTSFRKNLHKIMMKFPKEHSLEFFQLCYRHLSTKLNEKILVLILNAINNLLTQDSSLCSQFVESNCFSQIQNQDIKNQLPKVLDIIKIIINTMGAQSKLDYFKSIIRYAKGNETAFLDFFDFAFNLSYVPVIAELFVSNLTIFFDDSNPEILSRYINLAIKVNDTIPDKHICAPIFIKAVEYEKDNKIVEIGYNGLMNSLINLKMLPMKLFVNHLQNPATMQLSINFLLKLPFLPPSASLVRILLSIFKKDQRILPLIMKMAQDKDGAPFLFRNDKWMKPHYVSDYKQQISIFDALFSHKYYRYLFRNMASLPQFFQYILEKAETDQIKKMVDIIRHLTAGTPKNEIAAFIKTLSGSGFLLSFLRFTFEKFKPELLITTCLLFDSLARVTYVSDYAFYIGYLPTVLQNADNNAKIAALTTLISMATHKESIDTIKEYRLANTVKAMNLPPPYDYYRMKFMQKYHQFL